MISAEDQKRFEELRARSHCAKKFACLYSSLEELCQGQYHSDIDIFECMDEQHPSCEFARPFGCTVVCKCPLRKFIAQHFGSWSAEETALLQRPAET